MLTTPQEVNNMLNEVIDGFRNVSDIKFATLEEVKKLKDLVVNNKVKLGCTRCDNANINCTNNKEEIEFLDLYISDPTLELYLNPHSIPVVGEIFMHKK